MCMRGKDLQLGFRTDPLFFVYGAPFHNKQLYFLSLLAPNEYYLALLKTKNVAKPTALLHFKVHP